MRLVTTYHFVYHKPSELDRDWVTEVLQRLSCWRRIDVNFDPLNVAWVSGLEPHAGIDSEEGHALQTNPTAISTLLKARSTVYIVQDPVTPR
jgi:hypothetical protein